MILCWGEGHASAIHDHADAHCFMKMLKGELREIRYAWPTDNINSVTNYTEEIGGSGDNNDFDIDMDYNGDELQEMGRSSMDLNDVVYINGSNI